MLHLVSFNIFFSIPVSFASGFCTFYSAPSRREWSVWTTQCQGGAAETPPCFSAARLEHHCPPAASHWKKKPVFTHFKDTLLTIIAILWTKLKKKKVWKRFLDKKVQTYSCAGVSFFSLLFSKSSSLSFRLFQNSKKGAFMAAAAVCVSVWAVCGSCWDVCVRPWSGFTSDLNTLHCSHTERERDVQMQRVGPCCITFSKKLCVNGFGHSLLAAVSHMPLFLTIFVSRAEGNKLSHCKMHFQNKVEGNESVFFFF